MMYILFQYCKKFWYPCLTKGKAGKGSEKGDKMALVQRTAI